MKQILQRNEGLAKIADFLRENDGFILISHISPDGDTLGSALALYHTLKLHNKRVQVVCNDRVPYSLLFLPGSSDVIHPDKAVREDNVLCLDCADIARTGKAQSLFEKAVVTFNIDHHDTNTRYAMHNEVHHCASNSEIVYELIRLFAGNLSQDAANCLYTGLMTDTGSFAFSNTDASAFSVAAELVRFGADPCMCNTAVYRTVPLSKTKLLGKALSTVEMYDEGRIGLCVITQNDLAQFRAHADDAEGIIDHIRDIDTVEIAIIIRECLDGDYKIGLRSKSFADVATLAQNFGGGGHIRAAGCRAHMELSKLHDLVISAARDALRSEE